MPLLPVLSCSVQPLTLSISAKVSLQQSGECTAMSCLIASHLMDSVMDCVKVQCFRSLRQIRLACGSAILSIHSQLKVLLRGIRDNLTEQLSESGCMVSFLESCLAIVQAD